MRSLFDCMTREQLAVWYVDSVGYDPTVDDPTITTEQLRKDCAELYTEYAIEVLSDLRSDLR